MATSKILILSLIFATHYISYSTGSLEYQARQLCLSRKVAANVAKVCPEKKHKFDVSSDRWKGIAKKLASNRIKDLTKFEPETATVDIYTNWVYSGEGGKQILSFPNLTPRSILDESDLINNESEESPNETKMDNFGLNEAYSASYFDVKLSSFPIFTKG